MNKIEKMNLQLFAEKADGDSDQNAGGGSGDQEQPTMFTQAQVDAIVATRLAKEKKEEPDTSKSSQIDIDNIVSKLVEKLKPETKQSSKDSEISSELEAAKRKIARAAFDVMAVNSGVNPELLDEVANMMALGQFEVDDKLELDKEDMQTKLDELLKKMPLIKKQGGSFSGGANPGGGGELSPSDYGAKLGKDVADKNNVASDILKELYK